MDPSCAHCLYISLCCTVNPVINGVKPRSRVNASLEVYSPFLKGGNSVFITAMASALFFQKVNIGHSINYGPIGLIERK